MSHQFVDIRWRDRPVKIEYQLLNAEKTQAPWMIFLHEGLGSLSMWKDFPQQVCDHLGVRGLVYSRPAYGRSTPRPKDEAWKPDFMHQQANEVLPELIQALKIEGPIWLFGHSDGASIALLHACQHQVAGVIVLAPHILVEDVCISSIEKAKEAYLTTDLPTKLGRYHDDADSAFYGWNDIWLHPEFKNWSIEEEIKQIKCPVLAIQGLQDEYGTLEQIRGIARRLPQTKLVEIPDCGHSAHRDQPQVVLNASKEFFQLNSSY